MTDTGDAIALYQDNDPSDWNPVQGSTRFYELCRAYRDNEVGEVFSQGDEVARVLTEVGEFFIIALCGQGISKRIARRSIQSVQVANNNTADTKLKTWMELVKFNIRFQEAIRDCATYGRMFGFIWPTDKNIVTETAGADEPNTTEGTDTDAGYDLTFLTPLTTKAYYDKVGNIRKVVRVWVEEEGDDEILRVDEYDDKKVTHLFATIRKEASKQVEESDLLPYLMDKDDPSSDVTTHDMDRVPFFEFSLPGKLPAHWPAWGVQNGYTKVINLIIAACDFIVFPWRYLTQAAVDPSTPRGITEGVKGLSDLEDEGIEFGASLGALRKYVDEYEDKEDDFIVSPSAINRLKPGEDLRQLVQGSIGEMMELKDKFEVVAARVMNVPSYMITGEPPSGVALNELSSDFYTMVQDDNTRDGSVLVDMFQFVLELLGVQGDVLPVIAWNAVQTPRELTVAEMESLYPLWYVITQVAGIPEEQAKKLAEESVAGKVDFAKRMAEVSGALPAPEQ